MRYTVCRLSDLPEGKGYEVELEGISIALFRVGSQVHAIDNECPHASAPLASGDLRGSFVFCPLHAWGFDVRTGESDAYARACVRTFPVHVEGDAVQIEL